MGRLRRATFVLATAILIGLAGGPAASAQSCSVNVNSISVGGSSSVIGSVSLSCSTTSAPSTVSVTLSPNTATVVSPGSLSGGNGFTIAPTAIMSGNNITYSFSPLPDNGSENFSVLAIQANIANTGLSPGAQITATVVTSGGLGAATFSNIVLGTVVSPPPAQSQPIIAISINQYAPLKITVPPGANSPTDQILTISNSGGGTLNWTSSSWTLSGGNWLTSSPGSGSDMGSLTLTVNTVGMAIGTYNGVLQISAPGASDSPLILSIILTVGLPELSHNQHDRRSRSCFQRRQSDLHPFGQQPSFGT